uniref:Uncharacterized protein n=1 Tax=Meloidogyne enterolobii TaxID=390850 RepID=A0A6V7U2U7_MELEN|nr:unnamed protein product [Meloidogyne enterolobii]
MENNWELEQINQSLQGYQLNVLSLSAELQRTKQKLENSEKEIFLKTKEIEELKSELNEFQFVLGIDLKKLEQNISILPSAATSNLFEDKNINTNELTEKTRLIVLNNNVEWEEYLNKYKEQAILIVNSYKEQLEAKEKTLKEYRELVEQLKNEQQKPLIETTQESKENLPTKIQNPLKTSKEVLIEESRSEQWERRINSLEGRLRLLETENSELENERKRLVDILNKQRDLIRNRKNIQTQVNFDVAKIAKQKTTNKMEIEQNQPKNEDLIKNPSPISSPIPPQSDNEDDQEEGEETRRESQTEEDKTEGEVSGAGSSDSGTVVDDIGQNRGRRRKSIISGSEKLTRSKSSTAATRTIPTRTEIRKPDDLENLVLKHRNETRRLRMRLIELERRNKEYNSLRERSRISVRPLRHVDSSTIETTLKKENNRILKENSLLNKSNETLKTEAEQLKERLRRAEIHSKAGTELWETRKKHEQAMANIRKRLTEAEARERELHERLERRERHIEQMGRVQSDKLADNDKLNIALRQWRIEREELTKKTIRTEEEKQAINTRYSEAINRLDLLAKENKSLQKRIAHLQQNELKISEQLQQTQKQIIEDKEEKKKELKEINTQTDDLIIPSVSIPPTTPRTFLESEREFNILRESQLNETNKFSKFIEVEERERKLKSENRALIKDLRKAELYQRETVRTIKFIKAKTFPITRRL